MEQLRPSYWKKVKEFFKETKKSFVAPTTTSKFNPLNTMLLIIPFFVEQIIEEKLKLTNWGTTDKNAHIT